jgi:Putative zinc-finger
MRKKTLHAKESHPVKAYSTIRRRLRRSLLRTLPPCRKIVPLMSESLERRLSIRERLGLRLHLFVCAWCARYLRHIKSLRWILRGQSSQLSAELAPSLADDARERIARALQSGSLEH